MDTRFEQEGLKHLEKIEHELEEIKERTPSGRRAFLNGLLQGGGALLGGIAAFVLLGLILSFFIFTGFAPHTVEYVQGVVNQFRR
jgi:hypothetical protein